MAPKKVHTPEAEAAKQTDGAEGKSSKRTFVEEIEVSSEKLIEKIKSLAEESSVRRIRVKEPDGDIAVDIPLSVGAIAGGAVVLAAPILALVGALIAFFSKVQIEIVREEEAEKSEKEDT